MWILFAFCTAFLVSMVDAIWKKSASKADAYVLVWGWTFFAFPFLIPFLPLEKAITLGPSFFITLFSAAAFLVVALILYIKAIHASDLSLTMPMLAFTPIFLLFTSPVMLGEFPNRYALLGILCIVAGAYLLNITVMAGGDKDILEPFRNLVKQKGPRYMLAVALIFSVTSNLDKIGVQNSSPLIWVFSLQLVLGLFFLPIMLMKSKHAGVQIKSVGKYLLLAGFLNAAALLSQMVAIKMTLVAHVIAIKRMSVFFSALLGFFVFKEKGIKERSLGAILMIIGVILITTSH